MAAMSLSCRFYGNRHPDVDDVVMVNVWDIGNMGAYVHLLEYNNIEGMIQMSELTRRRIRSIHKLVRVNRTEVAVVLRVDAEKGYIELSKRRVSPEEVTQCEEKFTRAKTVNSILRHVGELLDFKHDEELDELYKKTAWMFDEKYKKQGAAYEAFKHAVTNPEILNECDIDDNVKEILLENVKRRLAPQPVKIQADVEVACTTYEGIDAIKRALKEGLRLSTESIPIKINLLAPPFYVVTTQTLDITDGLDALNKATDVIKASIEGTGGMFNLRSQPRVVSVKNEEELAAVLQNLDDTDLSSDEDDPECVCR